MKAWGEQSIGKQGTVHDAQWGNKKSETIMKKGGHRESDNK